MEHKKIKSRMIKLFIYAIITFAIYGFACPFLISEDDSILVGIGIALSLIPIIFIVNFLINNKQNEKDF